MAFVGKRSGLIKPPRPGAPESCENGYSLLRLACVRMMTPDIATNIF